MKESSSTQAIYCINDKARFPLELGTECCENIERTTNACFHSRFNSPKPYTFTFIEVVKQFPINTYVRQQSLNEKVRIVDLAEDNTI